MVKVCTLNKNSSECVLKAVQCINKFSNREWEKTVGLHKETARTAELVLGVTWDIDFILSQNTEHALCQHCL